MERWLLVESRKSREFVQWHTHTHAHMQENSP